MSQRTPSKSHSPNQKQSSLSKIKSFPIPPSNSPTSPFHTFKINSHKPLEQNRKRNPRHRTSVTHTERNTLQHTHPQSPFHCSLTDNRDVDAGQVNPLQWFIGLLTRRGETTSLNSVLPAGRRAFNYQLPQGPPTKSNRNYRGPPPWSPGR